MADKKTWLHATLRGAHSQLKIFQTSNFQVLMCSIVRGTYTTGMCRRHSPSAISTCVTFRHNRDEWLCSDTPATCTTGTTLHPLRTLATSTGTICMRCDRCSAPACLKICSGCFAQGRIVRVSTSHCSPWMHLLAMWGQCKPCMHASSMPNAAATRLHAHCSTRSQCACAVGSHR